MAVATSCKPPPLCMQKVPTTLAHQKTTYLGVEFRSVNFLRGGYCLCISPEVRSTAAGPSNLAGSPYPPLNRMASAAHTSPKSLLRPRKSTKIVLRCRLAGDAPLYARVGKAFLRQSDTGRGLIEARSQKPRTRGRRGGHSPCAVGARHFLEPRCSRSVSWIKRAFYISFS